MRRFSLFAANVLFAVLACGVLTASSNAAEPTWLAPALGDIQDRASRNLERVRLRLDDNVTECCASTLTESGAKLTYSPSSRVGW